MANFGTFGRKLQQMILIIYLICACYLAFMLLILCVVLAASKNPPSPPVGFDRLAHDSMDSSKDAALNISTQAAGSGTRQPATVYYTIDPILSATWTVEECRREHNARRHTMIKLLQVNRGIK